MANRRDRIEKLRRLSESDNPHEAARAREEMERLLEQGPDLAPRTRGPHPAYPFQLPGGFRIPTPLGGGSR